MLEKLRDAPLDERIITSIDLVMPILLSVKWERIIAKAVASTVKSVTSIKLDKPRTLPPKQYRHWINLHLIKHVFAHVSSYFSLPQGYRLLVHLLAKMTFYRIDEMPRELWSDFISLMIRLGKIKYRLPEEVAKVIVVLAAQLRLALDECYPTLLEIGEEMAERMSLLKKG
ncbi:MAG: hypothetical protein DRJ67_01595 [Thermoprotei archaeon]|nr:MAG: hypothetical protein DRJ67_01595 [Thermoprotei archaeon]